MPRLLYKKVKRFVTLDNAGALLCFALLIYLGCADIKTVLKYTKGDKMRHVTVYNKVVGVERALGLDDYNVFQVSPVEAAGVLCAIVRSCIFIIFYGAMCVSFVCEHD